MNREQLYPVGAVAAVALVAHLLIQPSSPLWFSYRLVVLSAVLLGFSGALFVVWRQGAWRQSQFVAALLLVLVAIVAQKAWLVGLTIYAASWHSPAFDIWLLGDEAFLALSMPLWLWLASSGETSPAAKGKT